MLKAIATLGSGGGGGSVNSVTGLNTDNTDAANPIVKISVDNSTIIGLGTPGSPLIATTGGGGTVTTTGSPASGNLTKFSGPTSITNGDLSGDVTTSGTLATTVAKIQTKTVSGTTGTGNVMFSASPTTTGTLTTDAVTASGQILTTSDVVAGAAQSFLWTGRSRLKSPVDGTIELLNNAQSGFTALQLGGTSSSFPELKRNGPAINFRLADDSADATVTFVTQSPGDNTTNGATTAFVTAAVTAGVPSLTNTHLFVGNASNIATDVAASGDLTLANTGAFTVAKIQGTTVSGTTGSGNVVFSTSPTLVTPALGTPSSGTLTNATGLPISTGVSGLGTGVATFLATPSSANLATAVTDETGSGALVFATSPTLVTPALGTPASGVMTNVTGTATGLTSGITLALKSATTTVDVSAATAPTAGQVLTATDSTHATWQAGGSGGSGVALTDSITQTAHGFSVGNVVRLSSGTYVLAQADTAANGEVAGIVSSITSANVFVLLTSGYITGLSGLTAGTVYFLSPSSAGALTATDPAVANVAGTISKPLLIADTTTSGYFNNWRGEVLGSTTSLPALTNTHIWVGNGSNVATDVAASGDLTLANTGAFTVAKIQGTTVSGTTGSGNVVFSTSPTLVTPVLGTPTSVTLTNGTGLPISTGVSGLGTGIATFLATPSSANLATAVTDETGSGALVFATSPTFVTPALGTPASGVATNLTGTASGLTAGTVTTNANLTGDVTSSGNATTVKNNLKLGTVGTNTSNTSGLSTGKIPGFVVCPYAGTITAFNFVVDAGTATVKVWKIATGTAKPTSANSINTSGVAISTGTALRSTTLSDFTSTTVTANDIFAFNIEAISGVTDFAFQLEITKT